MNNLSAFISRSLQHHARQETRDDHLKEQIEATFEKSMAFLDKLERDFYNNDDKYLFSLFLRILNLFVDGEISGERSLHRIVTGDIFRGHNRQLAMEYARDFVQVVPKFKSLANVLDAVYKKEGRESEESVEGPAREKWAQRVTWDEMKLILMPAVAEDLE